jgi:hypothetical protein
MASRVRDVDKGFRRVVRQFREANLEAAAGYPVGTTGTLASEGTPIWLYMAINEEGAPSASIPARPFMSEAWEANVDRYTRIADAGIAQVLVGRTKVRDVMLLVAAEMSNDIKRSIATGSFVPNAPSTVGRKGSTRPLFDTGAALSAVAFEVRVPRRS